MLFKEVIGQTQVKKQLIQTIQEGRISHAQLFLGQEGSGNLALAIAYAQYISCENKQESDSCGVCPSCNKYQKLIHPDLHFVFPVVTTKSIKKDPVSDDFIKEWRECILENSYVKPEMWYEYIEVENKQGIISKNESKEIIRKINLKTFEAEYKIMIIWMPEKMNITAANKLLKLLEEPPDKTLFLLVSENTERMLQTILSRCQLIKIPKIDNDSMSNILIEKFELENKIVENVVHLANGNYLNAMNIINSEEENDFNFGKFAQLMRNCYSNKVLELINWVEELASLGREKQKSFLRYALRMIRENYILNVKEPEIVYLADDEADFSKKFSPFINGQNVLAIYTQLNDAHMHIESNAYNKIVFLDMVLKLVKLIN